MFRSLAEDSCDGVVCQVQASGAPYSPSRTASQAPSQLSLSFGRELQSASQLCRSALPPATLRQRL